MPGKLLLPRHKRCIADLLALLENVLLRQPIRHYIWRAHLHWTFQVIGDLSGQYFRLVKTSLVRTTLP